MKGDLDSQFPEGRRDLHPPAGRRPHLHRKGRRHADPARPRADAGAQCRPPDDQPGGAGPRRQRSAGGLARRHDHRPDRPARCRAARTASRNSRTGSVYIVKPKMHGPAEVASPTRSFGRVEDVARHAARTLKMGIMDEERRTTVNLKECIARRRRPGGVHQHRLPGPHRRRDAHLHGSRRHDPQGRHEIRRPGSRPTRTCNVDVGLACGLSGHAQIGKGMWAMPDLMAAMLEAEDRPPQGRRQHRLGAVADRRHPACAALPQGGRDRAPARAARPADGLGRHHPVDPGGRAAELDAGRHPAGAGQQLPRASSATWCAGSTRASAAPRCRISTTWG